MRLLQSLTRGLKALDILREADEPLRLTHIAEQLDVDKSNASHILKTLVAAGYASQNSSRRYSAVSQNTETTNQHSLTEVIACKERCRPALEEIVQMTGECAHLAVLIEDRVWYIDKVDSLRPLKVDHPIGSLSPLHCTALGKAFLAFGNAKIPTELQVYTQKTIVNLPHLNRELLKTRKVGFAIDNEEFAEGIRCAAYPLFDGRGSMIAAIGISGPSVRIQHEHLKTFGTILQNVANKLNFQR